ncbi:hypothetical protein [Streptomyces sp. NPDC093970]|uniref:hypothetical protein n=1 Tax=Streptomyces sp. NPDC093970 TaxID=3155076 RepID=UPI003427D204
MRRRGIWLGNSHGTTAMWIRAPLDGLLSDEDFTGWHPCDDRPRLLPAQLAAVYGCRTG